MQPFLLECNQSKLCYMPYSLVDLSLYTGRQKSNLKARRVWRRRKIISELKLKITFWELQGAISLLILRLNNFCRKITHRSLCLKGSHSVLHEYFLWNKKCNNKKNMLCVNKWFKYAQNYSLKLVLIILLNWLHSGAIFACYIFVEIPIKKSIN